MVDVDLSGLFREAAQKFAEGGLVLEVSEKELVIVGDLHGDMDTLDVILEKWGDKKVLFLGDYVDRGKHGLEVLTTVVQLFLEGRAYVLRGNHESPLMNEDGGFIDELCILKKVQNCVDLYRDIEYMYTKMPIAAKLNGAVLAVHGGIPLKEPSMEPASLDELRKVEGDLLLPGEPLVYQALWNDPCECETYMPSPRGPGIWLFGRVPTERFLQREGLKAVVRGHLYAASGYMRHHGAVHTIFSSKAGPYRSVKPKVGLLSGRTLAIYDVYSGDQVGEFEL
ncbi:MAG: metallophosphoesterase [Thermoproteus sp.]